MFLWFLKSFIFFLRSIINSIHKQKSSLQNFILITKEIIEHYNFSQTELQDPLSYMIFSHLNNSHNKVLWLESGRKITINWKWVAIYNKMYVIFHCFFNLFYLSHKSPKIKIPWITEVYNTFPNNNRCSG